MGTKKLTKGPNNHALQRPASALWLQSTPPEGRVAGSLDRMNIPTMFAHGRHLVSALLFWILATGSTAVVSWRRLFLFLADKSKKRRIYTVEIPVFSCSVIACDRKRVGSFFERMTTRSNPSPPCAEANAEEPSGILVFLISLAAWLRLAR